MILRAGLAVVDHISQSMHYEDMLSWLLFYTSLLDLRKMPQVDITDPGGIVRSQVVEAANGALRIALNASQIQRTQSSRFLDEYFGSGVQHIALASNALVDTVAKLKANSVAILPFRKLLRRSRRSSRFIPRITRCLEGQQHVI
jgi:4-hydroxyphenylpyruvate dioxygenase